MRGINLKLGQKVTYSLPKKQEAMSERGEIK